MVMKRLAVLLFCIVFIVCLSSCGFTEQDRQIIIDTLKIDDVGILSADAELKDIQYYRYWGLFPGTDIYYIYEDKEGNLTVIRYRENKEQEDSDDYTYMFELYDVELRDEEDIVIINDTDSLESLSEYYYVKDSEGIITYYEVPPYEIGSYNTYYISRVKSFLSYTYKVYMEFN